MTTLRSFVVLCALLLPLPARVSPQEHVRNVIPGRDFEEQKMLTPGLTDVWKLHVEKDEMLLCRVESGAFDQVLDLVDARGNVLGSDDGAGTRSELWLRIAEAGDVEFRVRPFQGSGGGFYRYHLHRFRTEPIGTSAEASHQFGVEQWWHYRVALREGEVLVPTVLGDGRLRCVLDAMRNGIAQVQGGYRAPHTGDFFVGIEGPKDRKAQVLTQLARGRELSVGAACDERIAPYGLDHWRFCVRSGEAFVLDLQMPEVQCALELADLHPAAEGPSFVMTGHCDKGGQVRRYYQVRRDTRLELRVRNQTSTNAPYRALVSGPDRDMALGDPVHGRLALGDAVVHRLELTSGQLVRVSLESESFDGKLDLWDPWGNVFASVDDRGPLDRNPSHTFLVSASGTYRVLVYCAAAVGSGDFVLHAESLALPQLQANVPAAIGLEAGGTNYLHLDLDANQEVWLSVRSEAFDAGLTVLDPAGNASFRCEGGGLGGDVLVAYRASHRGRHTLLVHSRSGAGAAEVKFVPQ
ncbi:MAG TPA: hypothetical protein VF384_19630 [Planctomycetota bacterium]